MQESFLIMLDWMKKNLASMASVASNKIMAAMAAIMATARNVRMPEMLPERLRDRGAVLGLLSLLGIGISMGAWKLWKNKTKAAPLPSNALNAIDTSNSGAAPGNTSLSPSDEALEAQAKGDAESSATNLGGKITKAMHFVAPKEASNETPPAVASEQPAASSAEAEPVATKSSSSLSQ
jgi:hypothetical protein